MKRKIKIKEGKIFIYIKLNIIYLILISLCFDSKGIITIQHTILPTNLRGREWKNKIEKRKIQHTSHIRELLLSPLVWYKIRSRNKEKIEEKRLLFLFLMSLCLSSVMLGGSRGGCWRWRFALITLSKKPKRVDLLDKVGHTGPATEPKTNHQNPHCYKCIKCIHCSPAWHKKWRFLCGILQKKIYIWSVLLMMTKMIT